MISVQVIPDRFKDQAEANVASSLAGRPGSKPHIRRPTRGIVLKEETFATLRVVAGDGRSVPIVDAGSRRGPKDGEFYEVNGKRATDVYSNFFLQSIQEDRQEKQQIMETFGEPYIFLFGERARVLTFSGVLLNTFDFNWEAEWWHNYENYLRGTKCVENDARIFISFDETLVSGYIIASAATKDANNPHHVNFQFQLFVTSYANFSKIGDPHAADFETTMQTGGKYEFNLDEATARQFRPNIIDPNDNESLRALGENIVNGGNRAAIPNLIEGTLRTGLGPVVRTFKKAQQIADSALKTLSNLAAGEIVRVPIGFEGSMAFDVDTTVSLKEITGEGKITYSTFDQNNDEYVGSGTHYGSAITTQGVVDYELDPSVEEQRDSITYTINKAREIWSEAGLDIPSFQLGPISAFIAGKGIGLLAAGATAAWRTQNPMNGLTPRIRGA